MSFSNESAILKLKVTMPKLIKKLTERCSEHNRSSHQRCSIKKRVLRNFAKYTGKHLSQSPFLNKVVFNFIKKQTLAQVFSCEFWENFKNTFFTEHLRTTASDKR